MAFNSALLIIDMQVAMFSEKDPVYQGQTLLDKIKKLIVKARQNDVPVIYIQHTSGQNDDLAEGSPGWQIHPAITPLPDELIVPKRHPDSFQETVLQEALEKRGVSHLIVTGIQTEYCVNTTCRRAYSLGYDVTLIKDAHSTWNTDVLEAPQIIAHHNQVLEGWFVKLKSTDAVEI